MTWSREQILTAIEAKQWDWEETLVVPGFTQVKTPQVLMMKNERSTSLHANKVVFARFTEENADAEIDAALDFYGDKPFSWYVGPLSSPADLQERLEKKGFAAFDEYVNLALPLEKWTPAASNAAIETREVETEEDVRHHVEVAAQVWGYDERSAEHAVNERLAYLDFPERRGGYVVALKNGRPVGNGTYRLSATGQVMYLTGSAVLSEYRKQGIYHALLEHRFQFARERGVQWVTVQARLGTSEPILRKMGFEEYGHNIVLTNQPDA